MSPVYFSTAIALYFLLIITISRLTGRKATNKDFFIGSKTSPWYVVAFGMIGATLSGVTFISVPGWVLSSNFSYMQMVLGYILGYVVVAKILLPVYYKLNLTSIYTYLDQRYGTHAYKTGASLFLISRTIGASFRLFLVAAVLDMVIFKPWGIPFYVTVMVTIILIWLYTFQGGIKTIIWTDTLQTFFMLTSVVVTIVVISKEMNLGLGEMISAVIDSPYSRVFEPGTVKGGMVFIRQFLSGAFITIVMTGLDQDMMQKNISCKNLKDSQKNMLSYGFAFVPVNVIFLSLGVLLLMFAQQQGLEIPAKSDNLFPMIATGGHLNTMVSIFFILGLVAAAYSSADSALTSLTTSFTIDILNAENKDEASLKKTRRLVHIGISVVLFIIIVAFNQIARENVISSLFKAAGYTYGPLLGLYAFGLFTKWKTNSKAIPIICIASPIICYILNVYSQQLLWGYKFGYEILMLNGLLTFAGLWLFRYTKQ